MTAALDELAPSHITFAKGLTAGTANVVLGLVLDGVPNGGPLLAALVVGGFGYGASITLWVAGARDLGAARAQLVFATAPFVGAIVAWTAFGQAVSRREVTALVVAAVGVAFVLRSGHEHDHRHEPMWHDHEHSHDDGHHDHQHDHLPSSVVHQHRHRHDELVHAHPHVPDLHHKHGHQLDAWVWERIQACLAARTAGRNQLERRVRRAPFDPESLWSSKCGVGSVGA